MIPDAQVKVNFAILLPQAKNYPGIEYITFNWCKGTGRNDFD